MVRADDDLPIPDPRFYRMADPQPIGELAGALAVHGDPTALVSSVASFKEARAGALCYFDGGRGTPPSSQAIVIVPPKWADEAQLGTTRLVARGPRAAFSRLVPRLVSERVMHQGPALHASDVQIEDGAMIEPGVILGPGVSIGRGSRIGAGSVLGPGVSIGRDTVLGPGVKVRFSLVGDGVRIYAGAVLGEAGFGVAGDADGLVDVPHVGRVIIMDRVTLGAMVTVDRGMFGDTIVGEETKLDDHCHIAHNAVVGRRVRMAAFSGIAGSTTVGDGATFGGRVGVAEHLRIGVGSTLAAGSAVMHDIPDGETWGGYPAKPIRRWMREVAWLQRAIGKREGPDDT